MTEDERWFAHNYDAQIMFIRVQNTPETWQKMGRMKIERLIDRLYSPDLRPCDFWSFGRAKIALRDRRFADMDAVLGALT
jgi:hypothetical protein